ncbi:MAG: protoporphyrinogen oxidase [Oscillatoriales cyanobacterium SM2_2_1]|nr:protoporphyrinogen oxidase [Oscillatoriales cyanobacterium SM2_2_1]
MNSPSDTPDDALDVLVIGAGLSGLTAAYALSDRPQRHIAVWEATDHWGGNIVTRQSDGYLWEEGPNSFSPTPDLMRLLVDLGLEAELVLADRRLPRYVFWRGQLQAVPMSPPQALGTALLSPWGKLRAALGGRGFVRPAMASSPEETVAEFFGRHLGSEVLERLVAPFVSGVYAGDPQELSAIAAFGRVARLEELGGGLAAGAWRSRHQTPPQTIDVSLPVTRRGELGSFRDGLMALPRAIGLALLNRGVELAKRHEVVGMQQLPSKLWQVTAETPEGRRTVVTRTVVLAIPAHGVARLWQDGLPDGAKALRAVPYPSVVCVALGYPAAAVRPEYRPLQGFGHLIPRGQGVRTLGTIWGSSLFAGRAPQGCHLLLNFIGGATDPAIAQSSDDEIVAIVNRDLQRMILTPEAGTPKVLAVRRWQQAIPQYTRGHRQRIATAQAAAARKGGVFLCSNYVQGVALGDCVTQARQVARVVASALQEHKGGA